MLVAIFALQGQALVFICSTGCGFPIRSSHNTNFFGLSLLFLVFLLFQSLQFRFLGTGLPYLPDAGWRGALQGSQRVPLLPAHPAAEHRLALRFADSRSGRH
jgi:hypothetical protein